MCTTHLPLHKRVGKCSVVSHSHAHIHACMHSYFHLLTEMRTVSVGRRATRALSSMTRAGGAPSSMIRAGGRAPRRICLSVSSWFCIPEQGMKDMDILCRSSAFIVPVQNKEIFSEKSFHVVTCSHVVAPWKWPNYYPAEWLQAVNESHTYYTVELRQNDGVFQTQLDLLPRAYHHPNRDLAVLHFEDEKSSLDFLSALSVDALTLDGSEYSEQERLFFYGHEVTGPVLEDGTDMRVPVPYDCEGRFKFSNPRQNFAKTARVLSDGMCGGPMCSAGSSSSGSRGMINLSDSFVARGLIEGIIPENYSEESLQGLAAFIGASDIAAFVDAVESGQIEPLQGGQSANIVGSDQDPNKMNFDYITNHDKEQKNISPERKAEQEEMKRRAKAMLQQYSDEKLSPQQNRNRERKNRRD